jgi:hypothetical protein
MKRIVRTLLVIASLSLATTAFAEEQVLLGSQGHLTHGGFGAPVLKMTRIDGHSRLLMGAEGAWIVNHGFYVGLGMYGMPKGIATDLKDSIGDTQYLHMGYGGLLIGYTLFSDNLLHVGFQELLGGGAMGLSSQRYQDHDDHNDGNDDHRDFNGTGFLVLEPQVNAEINVTRFMRIALGAGYRYTWLYEEEAGYDHNDLGGITGSLAFKFGKF